VNIVRSADGTAIAYDTLGEGPALILVDGAMCTRSTGTRPQLAGLLPAHFTPLQLDRRGRGDSGDTSPHAVQRRSRTSRRLTLVMHGDASYPFTGETARALTQAIPHAELCTLAGQDHNVSPEVLAPILVQFFTS